MRATRPHGTTTSPSATGCARASTTAFDESSIDIELLVRGIRGEPTGQVAGDAIVEEQAELRRAAAAGIDFPRRGVDAAEGLLEQHGFERGLVDVVQRHFDVGVAF